MSRRARVVIPGFPHHVIQRGNNRRNIFYTDVGRELYLKLLREYCSEYGVSILGYCLMTNHVHLIASPQRENSLAKALGRTHNDYSRWLNVSRRESGHVWQNRFYSCPLERKHLWAALAYTERNPVRAEMVAAAEQWPWSSASAHLDALSRVYHYWLQMEEWRESWIPEAWRIVLTQSLEEAGFQARLAEATRTGRPLGEQSFVELCERRCGMVLRPQKRGPKAKASGQEAAIVAHAANLDL